jgi:hypothetical protein
LPGGAEWPKHVSPTEVVDTRLLGPLQPLVAWPLLRQAASDPRTTLASGDLEAVSHNEVISRVRAGPWVMAW